MGLLILGLLTAIPSAMPFSASAQITADRTLPNPSQITADGIRDLITGGTSAGSNLFHSFFEFNIGEGQQVYFSNPNGIDTILSRVTGGDRSTILGTLGVDGAADLFLINPNGILFGPNAQLDVNGSFFASTASELNFEDGSIFSATHPEQSLLTISTPLGLQYGSGVTTETTSVIASDTNGNITNQGHLAVPSGETLILTGNTVNHSGSLTAPSGRITLVGNQLHVIEPATLDASSDSGALGTVWIEASKIRIRNGSGDNTSDGLAETVLESIPGNTNLVIQASDRIIVTDLADNTLDFQPGTGDIQFTADNDGDGKGAFVMRDQASDAIRTFGRDVAIAAARLELGTINTATNPDQDVGQLLATAEDLTPRDGGSVTLTRISGQLSNPTDVDVYQIYISGTEAFSASTIATEGENATTDTQLFLFDADGHGIYSNDNSADCGCRQSTITPDTTLEPGIYYLAVATSSSSPKSAVGDIFPDRFVTLDFSGLDLPTGAGGSDPLVSWTSTEGVIIGDYDISLTGVRGIAENVLETPANRSGSINLTATNGGIRTGLLSAAATNGSGDIHLAANGGRLDITNHIIALGGDGHGGDVTLEATGNIRIHPQIAVLTEGQLAGDLRVVSDRDIIVQGGVLSQQSDTIVGRINQQRGGGFDIRGRSLFLEDGAQLISETLGTARLKTSRVDVEEDLIIGGFGAVDPFHPFGFLGTQVATGAEGNGGNLRVNVGFLQVRDASVLATRTFGLGNAGNLIITGNEVLVADAVDVTGNVFLEGSETLFESELSTEAEREEEELLFLGGITSNDEFDLTQANAGDMVIRVNRLRVEDGGEVSAGTHSLGNGGNFTLIANEVIVTGEMLGENSELGTETVPEFLGARPPEGSAGNLTIRSDRLIVTDGGAIGVATLALGGNAGEVDITVGELVIGGGYAFDGEVKNSSITSEVLDPAEEESIGDPTQSFGGDGGDIIINAETIALYDGGQITSSTAGNGPAGDIVVTAGSINIAGELIANPPPSLTLTREAFGNSLRNSSANSRSLLRAQQPRAEEFDPVSSGMVASSDVEGQAAGNIQISFAQLMTMDDNATIAATTFGDRGNITIIGDTLTMSDRSQITTNAGGNSTGGNMTFNVANLVAVSDTGNSDITANAEEGSGGQIQIQTRSPILGFRVGNGATFRETNLTPADTPSNDITAFSQFNPTIDIGTVTIEPKEPEPPATVMELPTLVDVSDRIATGCPVEQGNTFTMVSQGGLPVDPRRGLRGMAIAP